MFRQKPQPSIDEIKAILKSAEGCLYCAAPECHETTPEGVEVCAALPWWEGEPIKRETLLVWNELVRQLEYTNR